MPMPGKPGSVLCHLRRIAGANQAEDQTDLQLVKQFVARRDEAAFEALVRRHGRLVRWVCRHVLGHEQDADDAFQVTFLVLASKAASIRDGSSLVSWLYGTAFRTAMNLKRSNQR